MLSMQLYLWLHGCPMSHLVVNLGANLEPFNMQRAPEIATVGEVGTGAEVSTGRTTAGTTAEAQRIDAVVEQVKQYKREQDWKSAERALLLEIARQERDAKIKNWGVAPWCYEQLAIIYSKQRQYDMELAVLERYALQPKAPGMGAIRLKDRLEKSRSRTARRAS